MKEELSSEFVCHGKAFEGLSSTSSSYLLGNNKKFCLCFFGIQECIVDFNFLFFGWVFEFKICSHFVPPNRPGQKREQKRTWKKTARVTFDLLKTHKIVLSYALKPGVTLRKRTKSIFFQNLKKIANLVLFSTTATKWEVIKKTDIFEKKCR